MGRLFTIGYSGHSANSFVDLVVNNEIDVVCDVRSTPFSAYKPDFSRAPFKAHLNKAGVKYKFLGDLLGARPSDRTCYVSGQATYDRISKSSFFQEGLSRIKTGTRSLNLALVCSERDPIECHRAILVCRNLPEMHDYITHIHTDGRSESQPELDTRLVDLFGLTPPPLLQQEGDWLKAVSKAYEKQGDSIAYREKYPRDNKDEQS
jgi:uncharacterized protein (DUF488 family)